MQKFVDISDTWSAQWRQDSQINSIVSSIGCQYWRITTALTRQGGTRMRQYNIRDKYATTSVEKKKPGISKFPSPMTPPEIHSLTLVMRKKLYTKRAFVCDLRSSRRWHLQPCVSLMLVFQSKLPYELSDSVQKWKIVLFLWMMWKLFSTMFFQRFIFRKCQSIPGTVEFPVLPNANVFYHDIHNDIEERWKSYTWRSKRQGEAPIKLLQRQS